MSALTLCGFAVLLPQVLRAVSQQDDWSSALLVEVLTRQPFHLGAEFCTIANMHILARIVIAA